ncbi:MAG TPA: MFS transporter [Acidimicrobiales bacterium]|nr:MFS transporter [Acidimicrobiales bacterium]
MADGGGVEVPTASVSTTPADASRARATRSNATLVVLVSAALIYSLLQSLVVPALTTIQADLGASATATTWLLTAFLLSSAIATPILGRLGDMYGRGTMLLVSLASLTLGTALGAVAWSVQVLIVARIVQGLAGAIMPLGFGIIRDQFPPGHVPGAIGGVSAALAVGAGTGIVLSGPIATNLGRHWLFWIPLMVIAPTTLVAWWIMPRSAASTAARLDWFGAALLTGWLVALLLAVSQGPSWGWRSTRVGLLMFGAAALFVAWMVAELRSADPLVDVRLMGGAVLWRLNVISFTLGFAMQATFAFVPRFAQIPETTGFGLGVAADRAGLVVLPWSVGAIVTGVISGRLAARYGSKRALVVGAVLSILPFVLLALRHDRVWLLCLAMGVFGVGVGLLTAALPALLVAALPVDQVGASAGMNTNIRTIGGAMGAQVVAAIIASGVAADGLPRRSEYVVAFVLLGLVCAVGAVIAVIVPDGRGRRPPRRLRPSLQW